MQSFQSMEEKFDAMMQFMSGEFQSLRVETKEMRQDIRDIHVHLSRHDRQLRNHEERIGEIEGTIN